MSVDHFFQPVRRRYRAPWKLTYPLKSDGWKMKFLFKMVPFQGMFVHFRGGIPRYIHFTLSKFLNVFFSCVHSGQSGRPQQRWGHPGNGHFGDTHVTLARVLMLLVWILHFGVGKCCGNIWCQSPKMILRSTRLHVGFRVCLECQSHFSFWRIHFKRVENNEFNWSLDKPCFVSKRDFWCFSTHGIHHD